MTEYVKKKGGGIIRAYVRKTSW